MAGRDVFAFVELMLTSCNINKKPAKCGDWLSLLCWEGDNLVQMQLSFTQGQVMSQKAVCCLCQCLCN